MRKQKRRGLIFGLLAFSLAIFTGFLFSSQIEALERQVGDMQQVVVAKTSIAPRTLITADMLETRQVPRMYAHPSYVQSISDVADQRVAVVALEQGTILRQSDVALTSGLDDGWRAISIGVNPVAVLVDRVAPGSRVDIIVSYETSFLDREGKEVKTRRAVTLLNDIEVLAVNGTPQSKTTPAPDVNAAEETEEQSSGGLGIFGPPPDVSQNSGSYSSPYGLRDSVVIATLKVTPEQAQQLAYHDTFATDIRLSLRRNDDRAVEPLKPTSQEDFQ
ncbi:MAG TPA: Flp pilus assembly protein CpaB [Herpetosiphonaceae bacterium]